MQASRSLATLTVLMAVAASAVGATRDLPYPDADPSFDPAKINRALVEPAYKSGKPGYRFYALGPTGQTILAMVWDESKGTGSGYDTLYIDLNLNGDLREAGEKFVGPEGAKASPFRLMAERGDLFVLPSGKWRNQIVHEHKLAVPDAKLDYTLGVYYSFTRIDVSTKNGDWRFPMRMMDNGVPWGTVKSKAPVIRFGGTDWRFNYEHFVSRGRGRKAARVGTGKGTPPAQPGDKIYIDGTRAFFAGSSPCIKYGHGKLYSPWSDRGYTVRVESSKGKLLGRMQFNNSCGGNRWATTLLSSEYPDGHAVMVFEMNSGSHQGRLVQRIPFRVSNPNYGKSLPELAVTGALRKANPDATVIEIFQGARLDALGVPTYDGARDVYFGRYGLGKGHAQSCQNLGCGISFGHDVRNELHLGGEGRRALIKFDLSMLDANTKVIKAVLALNVMRTNAKIDTRTQAFALKKRWSEVLVRDGGGLYRGHGTPPRRYHRNWPVGTVEAWEKRMFEGDADRYVEPIGEVTFAQTGWVSLDVTKAVQNWTSGTWPNHGLGLAMVADRRIYGTHDVCLRASDYPPDPRLRPCLILVCEQKPKARPHTVSVHSDLAAASAAAGEAGKPLLVCALSAESLTSRAFETRTLADKLLAAWLDEHFVVLRMDAEDARNKPFLLDHRVRRYPSMIVMSPDPAQRDNYAFLQPLEWDVPDGIFRSSFEFEQLVARNLQNVLDRAKTQNGRYGNAGTRGADR